MESDLWQPLGVTIHQQVSLQLAPQNPEAQAKTQTQNLPQTPTSATDAANYVESVSVSLWEAYNLTEQDTPMRMQERRGSSLIAASSSE